MSVYNYSNIKTKISIKIDRIAIIIILIAIFLFSACNNKEKNSNELYNHIKKDISNEDYKKLNSNNAKTNKPIFFHQNKKVIFYYNNIDYEICRTNYEYSDIDIYYIKNIDVYYAKIKFDAFKGAIYKIEIKNDKVKIDEVLIYNAQNNNETTFMKIRFLYEFNDCLYFVNYKNIDNNYYAEVFYISNGQIFSKKDDILLNGFYSSVYYLANIDECFMIDNNKTGFSYLSKLYKIENDKTILFDDKIKEEVTDNGKQKYIHCSPYGLYYYSYNKISVIFYDGTENEIINNESINRIIRFNNCDYVYIITNEKKYVDMSNYIDLEPILNAADEYPSEEDYTNGLVSLQYIGLKKELKEIDYENFYFYVDNLYVASKKEIKNIAHNIEEYKNFDGNIVFSTKKLRHTKKLSYETFLEIVKKYDTVDDKNLNKIFNMFLTEYENKMIDFVYLYKGFVGTRLNFGKEVSKYVESIAVSDDDIFAVSGTEGKLYRGKLKLNDVSDLRIFDDDSNCFNVTSYNNKIFYNKRFELGNHYTYDWYELKDGKIFNISKDNNINIDFNINKQYMYDKIRKELYSFYNNEISIIKNDVDAIYIIKTLTNEEYEINYDKTVGKSYYEENINEYLATIIKDDENIEETKEVFIIKNYKNLTDEYINDSKKYKLNKYKTEHLKFYTDSKEKEFYTILDGEKIIIEKFDDGVKLPTVVVYDELKEKYYYNYLISAEQNTANFNVYFNQIEVTDKINKKLLFKTDVMYIIDWTDWYLKYIGDINEKKVFMSYDNKLYYYDNKLIKIKDLRRTNKNIESTYSINSFENKLYFLDYGKLYEFDKDFKLTMISENVKSFIALQNEVLYNTNFLYRYSEGMSERLFEVSDVLFVGKNNDNKCYIFVDNYKKLFTDKYYISDDADLEMKKLFDNYKNKYLYNNFNYKSLFIYENGSINKLLDNCKYIYDSKNVDDVITKREIDKMLVLSMFDIEEKIDFREIYDNTGDEEKLTSNKFLDYASKYKLKYHLCLVENYNLYLTNELTDSGLANNFTKEDYYIKSPRLTNIIYEDKKVSFSYNTYKYLIDFYGDINIENSNDTKNNKKSKKEDFYEIEVIKMTYYIS